MHQDEQQQCLSAICRYNPFCLRKKSNFNPRFLNAGTTCSREAKSFCKKRAHLHTIIIFRKKGQELRQKKFRFPTTLQNSGTCSKLFQVAHITHCHHSSRKVRGRRLRQQPKVSIIAFAQSCWNSIRAAVHYTLNTAAKCTFKFLGRSIWSTRGVGFSPKQLSLRHTTLSRTARKRTRATQATKRKAHALAIMLGIARPT